MSYCSVKDRAIRTQNIGATRQTEKEKIAVELDLAKRIQEDMLPRVFPPFPDRTDFDV